MSKIRLTNYMAWRRHFQKLVTQFPQDIQDAMMEAADGILIPAIRQQILASDQVFFGDLYWGILAEKVSLGNTPAIKVGSYEDYATNVEQGSPPRTIIGTLEFYRLIDWATTKHQLRGKAARAMAAAAARTIEGSGNKGNSFLARTWRHTQGVFWKDVFSRVNRVIKQGP